MERDFLGPAHPPHAPPTPVYDGPRMRVGHRIVGPAIIEEPFTTIVVHPRQRATLDRFGNYHVRVG